MNRLLEVISLRDVTAADRSERWEEVLSEACVPLRMRFHGPGSQQRGVVRRRWIGDLSLVDIECDPCTGVRGRAEVSETQGEYLVALFVLAGEELVGSGELQMKLPAGSGVIWDTRLQMHFETLGRVAKRALFIPRTALQEVGGHSWSDGGRVLDATAPSVRLLSGYLDTLSSTLDDLPQAAVSSARNAALELFVGALRPINPLDGDGSAALRTQMDRWLDRRLQDPGVNAELLARAHSVSVRTVHRIYGRSGETPSGVLRLRRLMRARDDLVLSDFPIGMIAHQWRFADASHFCRAFKLQFGCSPTDYRLQARRGGAPPSLETVG